MKSFVNLFARSARELKSFRCIAVTAMLIALDLVLKMTVSIRLTESLTISFAFIALAAVGMLYGPTVGALAGFITDILGFIIRPSGSFDIRYTLIEMLGAVIYGLFLYNALNDKWLLTRVIAAKSTVVIVCNLIFTTMVTASYYGKGFFAMLPARIIKNLAQLPVDVFLLALILPIILRAYNIAFAGVRKVDENLVFSDENVVKGLITVFALVFVLICALAIGGQYIRSENAELSDIVEEQQAQIDNMQAQIDALYLELGIDKPISETNE